SFITLSKILNNETSEYKRLLKENLKQGKSYILARRQALNTLYKDVDLTLLDKPNNILGLEYVKAILKNNYDFNICILKREDNGFNCDKLDGEFSSALSIRTAISNGEIEKTKNALPLFTYSNLPSKIYNGDSEILYALLDSTKEDLKKIPDCIEGLENKLKTALYDSFSVEQLLEKVNTKRYTDARIRRILINNLLNIDKTFVKKCLKTPLYFRVLAVKKGKEKLLKELNNANTLPVIERKSSINKLSDVALKCLEKDLFANEVYSLITKSRYGDLIMKKV
ncbi:MAG: nucleotidyltransferase family protein, partial [Clostridia bacterium]|nr:nucleotidyltransferase family protein [Clostridia bacterium]